MYSNWFIRFPTELLSHIAKYRISVVVDNTVVQCVALLSLIFLLLHAFEFSKLLRIFLIISHGGEGTSKSAHW